MPSFEIKELITLGFPSGFSSLFSNIPHYKFLQKKFHRHFLCKFLGTFSSVYIRTNSLQIFRFTVCKIHYVYGRCLHIIYAEVFQFGRGKFATELSNVYAP